MSMRRRRFLITKYIIARVRSTTPRGSGNKEKTGGLVEKSDKKPVIDKSRVKEKNVLLFYNSTKYNNLYAMI
jgi:hypothetical protein